MLYSFNCKFNGIFLSVWAMDDTPRPVTLYVFQILFDSFILAERTITINEVFAIFIVASLPSPTPPEPEQRKTVFIDLRNFEKQTEDKQQKFQSVQRILGIGDIRSQ